MKIPQPPSSMKRRAIRHFLNVVATFIMIAGQGQLANGQQFGPDEPQYQSGTSQEIDFDGLTAGTALNGNPQLTIPAGDDTYVFGQNNSTPPQPAQPSSYGFSIGVGTTF
jgi:hypothetical protein